MKISGLQVSGLRDHALIQLATDDGLRGTALMAGRADARMERLVDELLIGSDPRATSHHWTRFTEANDRGDLSAEIAAIDIALWDLRAQRNAEPLWRSLGALRPRVNTHARVAASSRNALSRWHQGIARMGIRSAVLEASADVAADAEVFAQLRQFLGHGMDRSLMLDAQARWSSDQAIRAIEMLEQSVDLTWIEAPTRSDDPAGLKHISEAIRGAVCVGASFMRAADYQPHLKHRSINVVQIDITRTGITQALRIADAAYGYELPIALAPAPGNIHAHLAAALPYCASIELSADAMAGSIRVEDGWAIGNDTPGHGLTFA